MHHDDCRAPSPLSILTALGLALALVPACDEPLEDGEEPAEVDDDVELEEEEVEFRSGGCPDGWDLYGEWAGGFCCDGYTDGNTCDGTICALDETRTQGFPMCSAYICPADWTAYGAWAGGFCCSGYTDGNTCAGAVCALDPSRTQGNPMCDLGAPPMCPEDKVHMGGMYCSPDGYNCEVEPCPQGSRGYEVCFSSEQHLAPEYSKTQCIFVTAPEYDFSGMQLTVPTYWQTRTRSVAVKSCDVDLGAVFVYDGYGQTSDTSVIGASSGWAAGGLYPWIENDARSMWISTTDKYMCLLHRDNDDWKTCVPPTNTTFNLAGDFNDQIGRVEASPNWIGLGASLYEHNGAGGQGIYVSANENLVNRPIVTNGQWLTWRQVLSSFRFYKL